MILRSTLLSYYTYFTASVVFAILLTSTIRADDMILGKSGGISDGWKIQAWGGLSTATNTTVKKDEFSSLEIVAKSDVAAYAGISLNADNGIPLTDEMRKSGYVTLYIQNGKTSTGIPGDEQTVQLGLTFLGADGKPIHAKFSPVTIPAATKDAGTWQQVKIPIADQLSTINGAAVVSLAWIRFQYVGPAAAGVYLADCTLTKKADQ